MPRIHSNPALSECPDFASPTYAEARAPLVNLQVNEAQAIQLLRAVWSAGNEADKLRWQVQCEEDEASRLEQACVHSEAETLKAQAEIDKAEAIRKEEIKKNKSKYIPIPDRDVPSVARVVASNYASSRMDKGLYVELWYYTNTGLDEAFRNSNTVDNEAMIMVRLPNGSCYDFSSVYLHTFSTCRTVALPHPHSITSIDSAVCFTIMLFTYTCLPFVLRRMYFIHATYMFTFYLSITCHASMAYSYINLSVDLAVSLASL